MNPFLLAELRVSSEAVLVFGGVFLFVLLAGGWVKWRRRAPRRRPYQTDVDDFARIFRL